MLRQKGGGYFNGVDQTAGRLDGNLFIMLDDFPFVGGST